VAELSEWLQIMLGEVSRKREEDSRADAEGRTRAAESAATATDSSVPAQTEVR